MKCLSLTQPYASLIALGHKRVETRDWRVSYRGPIAIHASKGFPKWAQEFAMEQWSHGLLPGPLGLPLGAVVATANLVRIEKTEVLSTALSDKELYFGDYGPCRYGWMLEDVKPLPVPIPARGMLGLWEWRCPE